MTHDSASLRIAAATFSEEEDDDEEDIARGLAFVTLVAVHVDRSVDEPFVKRLPHNFVFEEGSSDTPRLLHERNQFDVSPQVLSVLCFHGGLGSCSGGVSRWRELLVAYSVPELALLVVSLES